MKLLIKVFGLLFCLTLLFTACDEDDQPGGDPNQVEGPLYVVSNTVFTPDGSNAYITVVSDLDDSSVKITDLSQFLEFSGSARAYGLPGQDVVYVTSDEKGTMTEVTFAPDGAASIEREVSFAGVGVNQTSGGNVNVFFSSTKAYHINQNTLEVIVWNPDDMELIDTFPLGLGLDPGMGFRAFLQSPILVGKQLVLLSLQSIQDSNVTNASGTDITIIDTDNDVVVSNTSEPRGNSFLSHVSDAAGNLYFATSPLQASHHFLRPDEVAAPIILRMLAGETTFDPDWSRSLVDEVNTSIWTGVTPGNDGTIYIQAIQEDNPGVQAATDAFEVNGSQPWIWYALNNPNSAPQDIQTGLNSPPVFSAITIDDDAYIVGWDNVNSTVINTTAAGGPRAGLEVPGFVYNIVRIR